MPYGQGVSRRWVGADDRMSKEEKSKMNNEMVRQRAGSKDLLGVNSEIGRKLRQMYDDIASDAVPDRFIALLSELEQAENKKKG